MTYAFRFVVLLGVVFLGLASAGAQGVGVRAGVSFDPEQFYFGVHGEAGPVVGRVAFRPNLEIGVGSNRTIVALNGEFTYPFALRSGTRLYAGGGPGLVFIRRDRPGRPGSDTNLEPGFNILMGWLFNENYHAELKVGLIDSPRFKIGLGYTF